MTISHQFLTFLTLLMMISVSVRCPCYVLVVDVLWSVDKKVMELILEVWLSIYQSLLSVYCSYGCFQVKYFDRRRDYIKFKEKMDKEGFDPVVDTDDSSASWMLLFNSRILLLCNLLNSRRRKLLQCQILIRWIFVSCLKSNKGSSIKDVHTGGGGWVKSNADKSREGRGMDIHIRSRAAGFLFC